MEQRASRKGIWGWMLFDWAGQPFHTLVITFFFGPYFVDFLFENSTIGQANWGFLTGFAGILVALSAPFMGAAAEKTGPRKPWVFAFGLLFVIGCFGLWGATPGMDSYLLLYLYFIAAFIGAEYIIIFTNSMLPDLVPKAEIGKLSGYGWALGYAGGFIVLLLVLALIATAPGSEKTIAGLKPIFGLDANLGEPARAMGPLSAIWFIIFAIPFFLFTPDRRKDNKLKSAINQQMGGIKNSWRTIKHYPQLWMFFLASMLYRDALVVLYVFGAVYAKTILGWSTFELGVFGMIAALTGAFGAWFGGWADHRWGAMRVVQISIIILLLVSVAVLTTTREFVLLLPVSESSSLPDLLFFICGGLIGAAGGAMSASSRGMVVHFVDGKMPITEAFGFYAMAGKATAFIGPIVVGFATLLTGSQRLGISPVILLFLGGMVLLSMAKKRAGADL